MKMNQLHSVSGHTRHCIFLHLSPCNGCLGQEVPCLYTIFGRNVLGYPEQPVLESNPT